MAALARFPIPRAVAVLLGARRNLADEAVALAGEVARYRLLADEGDARIAEIAGETAEIDMAIRRLAGI